jgi:hypothetical protein
VIYRNERIPLEERLPAFVGRPIAEKPFDALALRAMVKEFY